MQEFSHGIKPAGLPDSSTATPAPYGHACKNCAKAKCKCIYSRNGADCERCSRLNKPCQPSIPTRRRNPKKPQVSRTAHLEEKLDDLVSLIRSQASRNSLSGPDATAATTAVAKSVPGHQSTTSMTSSDSSPQGGSESYKSSGSTSANHTSPAAGTPHSEYALPMDDKTAEARLALFRQHMLTFSPVIYISPTTTAREIQQSKPFLWLGIVACTSSSVRQAYATADKMRTLMANKLVLSGQRSLDLLQGLLVFLHWPQCQRRENPYLMMWTNLGVTLAQDLGYTGVKNESVFAYSKKFWGHSRPQFASERMLVERTMEDRRAALAFYAWHVMASDILRLDNRLRWTPFMEESLRILQQQPEWEGDLVLATQSRCALVTQQLTDIVLPLSISGEKQIPLYLHKALLSQIHDIWRTLPASLSQNEAILLQLHATEVNIHELAIAIEPAAASTEIVKRLEVLQQCVKSLESWFDIIERITPGRYVGMTFGIYVQLLSNIIILSKLTSPGLKETSTPSTTWDPAEIRKRIDPVALLDRLANSLDESAVLIGIQEDEPGGESIWLKCSRAMRVIMKSIQEESTNTNTLPTDGTAPISAPVPDQQNDGPQAQLPGSQDPFMTSQFGDDPWLISSFFVPWDSMNF